MYRATKPLVALAAFVVSGLLHAAEAPRQPVITKLKKLFPRTALVENGRPRAVILIPAAPAYRRTAERLQAAIRRATGATLPVQLADEVIDKHWRVNFRTVHGRNIIALGNVNTNRLLSRLCGERYVVADSVYPGKGGHVVRTIHDPFAKGVNVLALCGSSPAGVEKAVAVFAAKYLKPTGRSLALPGPIVDVKFEKRKYRFFPDASHSLSSKRQPQYTGMDWFRTTWRKAGFMDEKGRVISNKDPKAPLNKLTSALARMEQTYFRTGNPALLPLMKQLVEKNRRILNNPAKGHSMSTRTAGDVPHWDRMEELPIWTDRDRLAITNAFLRDIRLGGEKRRMHTQVKEGAVQVLDENHGTNSALGSFVGWQYFDKYYRLPDSEFWMKLARACFAGQASTYQILEDAAGYLTSCVQHSMSYALRSGDLTYFERGIPLVHGKYVSLACVNNCGWNTGFGDASALYPIGTWQLLARAAWYFREPRFYWVLRNTMPDVCGLRVFQDCFVLDLDVEPVRPDDWLGVTRFPLYVCPLEKAKGRKVPVYAPKKEVGGGLFNKIVFKENWDPDGQYLLLDGAGARGPGPHGHCQPDINTIINFCALGRMWLVDHSYQMRAFRRHSGVLCELNGKAVTSGRVLAKLENMADTPRFGVTRTRTRDWDRAIVWRKGRWFAVLDRIRAGKSGEMFARSVFKGLGEARLEGKDFVMEQAGRFCRIISDGQAAVDIEPVAFRGGYKWPQTYKHAQGVAKFFQQDKLKQVKTGETIGFINLLYPYASPGQARDVKMLALGKHAALITDRGKRTLIALDDIPGAKSPADMRVVSDDAVHALGAKDLCGGLVTADKPCDLGVDLEKRKLFVRNREERRISLAGRVSAVKENGKTLANGRSFVLPAGEHVLTVKGWTGFDRAASWKNKAIASAASALEQRRDRIAADQPKTEGLTIETVKLGDPVTALERVDLDGDGRVEWVTGGPKGVSAWRPDGRKVWSFATKKPVRCVAIGQLRGDARPEIAVGCDDEHVYLLDHRGRKQWSFKCKPVTKGQGKAPKVDQIWIADLEGDGENEVVAGACYVHVLKPDGSLKWERYLYVSRGRISGDFFCGAVDDITGDGKKEVIVGWACAYPKLKQYDCRGAVREGKAVKGQRFREYGGYCGGLPNCIVTADLFGGKKEKQYVVGQNVLLSVKWQDQRFRERAGTYRKGAYTHLAVFQPDPKRPPVILSATAMTTVRAYTGWQTVRTMERLIKFGTRWRRTLGEKISALLPVRLKAPAVDALFVGTKAGNVRVFSVQKGKPLAQAQLNGPTITCLVPEQEANAVLAVRSDGAALRLRLEAVRPSRTGGTE